MRRRCNRTVLSRRGVKALPNPAGRPGWMASAWSRSVTHRRASRRARSFSVSESRSDLKRAGSTSPKSAPYPGRRLSEPRVQQIVGVSGKIRKIEDIEDFQEDAPLHAIAKADQFRNAEILRIEISAKVEIPGQRHTGEDLRRI